MIKMFYIFILLCCMAPFNGHTEEFLQTKNSFLLVKAVKLGRSSVESNNILSSTAGKNELLKKCDPNCSNCNKVTGECLACDSGRFLNDNLCLVCPKNASCSDGKTFKCVAGCYATTGATSCVTCPAGTYSRGAVTSCFSCSQNCTSCTSDTQCTQCETGYTLQNGKCVKLNLVCCPNYSICDSSTGICSKCEIGRYYNAALNECMPCPYGCARCSDFNSCTNCYTGFTLRGGVCTNRGNGSLVDALY